MSDSKPLHIGIFMRTDKHHSGGRYLGYLMFAALSHVCHVTLITNNASKKMLKYFTFGDFECRIENDPAYRKHAEKNEFDAVLGHPFPECVRALEYAQKFEIPCYQLVHETPNFCRTEPLRAKQGDAKDDYVPGFRKALVECSGIIAVSKETQRYCEQWLMDYQLPPIETIYQPINSWVAEKKYGHGLIKEDGRSLIFIGRHIDFKDPSSLITKIVKMKKPPDKIYVVGAHLGNDSEMQLLHLAKEHPEITFELAYDCDDATKFKFLKKATILCHPSSFEGFGRPPMEAMYFGKDVIAYDIPVLREVYGEHIEYVPVGDEDAFITAIDERLNQRKAPNSTAQNKRAHVQGWCDPIEYANKVLEFITANFDYQAKPMVASVVDKMEKDVAIIKTKALQGKILLFVTTFGRLHYMRHSFLSLLNSNLPPYVELHVLDDGTREEKAVMYLQRLKQRFRENHINGHLHFNTHIGLPDAKIGRIAEILKVTEYDKPYFVLSDSDVIYSRNWFQAIEYLYSRALLDDINIGVVTGFRRRVPGFERQENNQYSLCQTYGGPNMLVPMEFYRQFPFKGEKWDHNMSADIRDDNRFIVVPKRSIVDHIGQTGAHSGGGKYDKAESFIGKDKDAMEVLGYE